MTGATRKIIHIDMDAFYASIEQRDKPELCGLPVVVGGNPEARGVVATCSYEARKFGVHSAMPAARARRLCPQAIFLRPRFDVYRREATRLRELLGRYTPLVEPLSLDEAYLDVTGCADLHGSATHIAEAIRSDIRHELELTASAGVSYNKFLAKLASDLNKPDGLAVILPEQGEEFVARLPVGRFHGIGPATAARMKKLNIHTGADLRRLEEYQLVRLFGRAGQFYYRIARGIDARAVNPNLERKSLGAEETFDTDLTGREPMLNALNSLSGEVATGLQRRRLCARTVTLKLRYQDFQTITRSMTLQTPLQTEVELYETAVVLLDRTEAHRKPVRLLGITASALDALWTAEQYGLFAKADSAPSPGSTS